MRCEEGIEGRGKPRTATVFLVLLISIAGCIDGEKDRDSADDVTMILLTPHSTGNISLGSVPDDSTDNLSIATSIYPDCHFYLFTEKGGIYRQDDMTGIKASGNTSTFGEERVVGVALANHSTLEVAPTILTALGMDPARHAMDAAPLTDTGFNRVVLVIVDGLGWNTYNGMKREPQKQELIVNLSAFDNVTHALTTHPPMTNVGVSMMLTGRTPAVNGVDQRNARILAADSVFDVMESEGSGDDTTTFVEGDIRFLDMDMSLTIDEDRDGQIDDDILEKGLHALDDTGRSLVVIHFHGIDDAGHSHGIFSNEHGEAIERVDGYVGEIRQQLRQQAVSGNSGENGSGTTTLFMVVADHGMHNCTTGDGSGSERSDGSDMDNMGKAGTHGDFRHEDMYSFMAWEGIHAA